MTDTPTLPKNFDPATIEKHWYAHWEANGLFRPERPDAVPYTIVNPPPNVTGSLHIGHALDNTLQDVMIRYERLRGKDALWVVGTDHAGIATQMVVERQMALVQDKRTNYSREDFIAKVWEWKHESGGTITSQLRRLGCSMDWSREQFTMDPHFCTAVTKVFVDLYNKGLIYRDKRLVNWDPGLKTAISDLEVEQKEVQGHFWHFRYPLEDGSGHIAIATTRPETILGDGAVAVHPDDTRYQHLIGKKCRLPIVDRLIPIIADTHVKIDFGSGAVKITAAHDHNDYDVYKRHPEAGIPLINLMNADATMSDNCPEAYRGLDRYVARAKVVAEFDALGLLDKIEPHTHMVPYGDRSGVVIEPWLTDQWYVDAETLAQPAIAAVKSGAIEIVPKSWEKTYFNWMENIQPWCVSRQLWWGHRIPAWYGDDGEIYVAENAVAAQALAGDGVALSQDNDVLDTWFSSALWPFATLGWPGDEPEKPLPFRSFGSVGPPDQPKTAGGSFTRNWVGVGSVNTNSTLGETPPHPLTPSPKGEGELLARHYPNDLLISGFDILFFWDARMAMQGIEFMGDVPWRKLYLHGLVRAADGQKMSKSKGNVVDPLGLIDQFGADALRFFMAAMESQGRDIKMDDKRVEGYRNFATKLWNAARFCQANGIGASSSVAAPDATLAVNKWIIGEVVETVAALDKALADLRFDAAANTIYHFVWDRFCDWYLELVKPVLSPAPFVSSEVETPARGISTSLDANGNAQETRAVAGWVLDQILVMLHPFMPFITEELWHAMGERETDLIIAEWPQPDAAVDAGAKVEIEWLIELVTKIRAARSELNIVPGQKLAMFVYSDSMELKGRLSRQANALLRMARLTSSTFSRVVHGTTADGGMGAEGAAITVVVDNVSYKLPLEGVIDLTAERARLTKAKDAAAKEAASLAGRLSNPAFLEKAKPEAVEKAKADHAEKSAEAGRLAAALARLGLAS